MSFKVIISGFGHESNTFSPFPTLKEDFYFVEDGPNFVQETIDIAKNYDVEIKQAGLMNMMTGGKIPKEDFETLCKELLEKIKEELPADGILLRIHGGMEVDNLGHGTSEIVKRVRELVGENVLIATYLDLHGNIPKKFEKYVNIALAMRTAPHSDAKKTFLNVAEILFQALENKTKPVTVVIPIPMLFPGEKVITDIEPAKSLYKHLESIDSKENVLTSSLMVGFAWSDVPHAGSSTIVSAINYEIAEQTAKELALVFWNKRKEFDFECETLDVKEAILEANNDPKTVFLSDSGDNVTAGAAGDICDFLEELINLDIQNVVFAQIYDKKAVKKCMHAGVGKEIDLTIGGNLDKQFGKPYQISGTIKKILDVDDVQTVLLQVNGIELILMSKRWPFRTLKEFEELEIDLLSKNIVVVKLGYLYPELKKIAPRAIMALSKGPACQSIEKFEYKNVRRPIFPLDYDMSWKC